MYNKETAGKLINDTINSFMENAEDLIEFSRWVANNSYNYTLRNSILIRSQNLGAVCCQSKYAWEKAGYHVKEEESRNGAQVFVPMKKKFVEISAGEWKPLSDLTKAEKAKYKENGFNVRSKLCFGFGFTFDISQTDCPTEEYNKFVSRGMASVKHADAWAALKKYTEQCGIPVYDGDDETAIHGAGLFGFCRHGENGEEIHLANTLKDTQKLSVGGHEIGHALLHGGKCKKSAAQKEVEADIFSILINTHFGVEIEETRKRHLKSHFEKLEFDEETRNKELTNMVNGVFDVYKKYIAEVDKLIAA